MRFTIDRFEGDFAVVELENREMLDIPKILLPDDSKEGDVLLIVHDTGETENRKKRIEDKFKKLLDN